MSHRILLTGSTGQVGRELARGLPALGEVIAPGRAELDLMNTDEIRRAVRDVCPSFIVNAAAYTAVDRAESEPIAAHAINAEAPAVLAEEAKRIGAMLVHFSTDYVFDGSKNSPYSEPDAPNPLNVYGKTKLAGEKAIQESGVPYLIFRTAWVYSTQGKNFLLTILRLAADREELRVVCDQLGAPTWSSAIAASTLTVLERFSGRAENRLSPTSASGVFHMTAAGVTSWHGFAEAILEEVAQVSEVEGWLSSVTGGRPIIAHRVVPIKTAEYPTPARRPSYSVLSNSLLRSTFGISLPPWEAQLRAALTQNAP
jgi:dTDP-4-dehydrorhamnose reductase